MNRFDRWGVILPILPPGRLLLLVVVVVLVVQLGMGVDGGVGIGNYWKSETTIHHPSNPVAETLLLYLPTKHSPIQLPFHIIVLLLLHKNTTTTTTMMMKSSLLPLSRIASMSIARRNQHVHTTLHPARIRSPG